MKNPRYFIGCLSVLLAGSVGASENYPTVGTTAAASAPMTEWASPDRYYDLFAPLNTEQAALSPDGKKVAFSYYKGEDLFLFIVKTEAPFEFLARVHVGTDKSATPIFVQQGKETTPIQISWLGWVDGERLAFQTNQVISTTPARAIGGGGARGYVFGINADGSDLRELASPLTLARGLATHQGWENEMMWQEARRDLGWSEEISSMNYRPRPDLGSGKHPTPVQVLDFDPAQPGSLLIKAGFDQDYEVFSVDARSGKKKIARTERIGSAMSVLLDRQHEANIGIHNTTLTSFPHRYEYDEPRRFSLVRWKPLERFIEGGEGLNFTLSPENFAGERSIPLGFDENREVLYFASDVGRETYGIYGANLKTGKRLDLAIEHPEFDLVGPTFHGFEASRNLIYDRYTRAMAGIRYEGHYRTAAWINPAWQAHQEKLEKHFPHRSVDLLEWDQAYDKFLVRVNGPADPGRYYLYEASTGKIIDFLAKGEVIDRKKTWTASVVIESPEGRDIPVRLTVPVETIHTPIPLIVLFSDNVYDRLPVDFDREALAFARMGYVVAQFSGRGAWGYGRESREAFFDGGAVAQAEEVVHLVAALKERFEIHPEKIALVGENFGGYLALQTLRQHPDLFRCAIALNAPLHPTQWIERARWNDATLDDSQERALFGDSPYDSNLLNLSGSRWSGADDVPLERTPVADRLTDPLQSPNLRRAEAAHMQLLKRYVTAGEGGESSLVNAAEEMAKPVLFFAYRREDGDPLAPAYNDAYTLSSRLRAQSVDSKVVDLHRDYQRGLPEARADVFAEMAGFLNTHMFDYDADNGTLEIQEYAVEASASAKGSDLAVLR